MNIRRWLGLALLAGMPGMGATRIHDTVYYAANGQRADGQVTITWPSFVIGEKTVVAGRIVLQLRGGSLAVDLDANDAAIPAGTRYTVQYRLNNGAVSQEYWVVPTSGTAVTIAAVRVSSSTPTVGDCVRWTGTAWVAEICGGGTGGGNTWDMATLSWGTI